MKGPGRGHHDQPAGPAATPLGIAVRQGLWDAWDRFEKDDDAKVAILTGTGEKAFCAGMDLKGMSATTTRTSRRAGWCR